MNNCFKHDLKERLENRKVWSSYFLSCLKHWELSEKVSEKYYKDKFLLSIVLKLYFLPINLVKYFYKTIPILGVCLGHQIIGQVFKSRIILSKKIMHGKTSKMKNLNSVIFKGLPKEFDATRYHSLIIKKNTLPDYFKIISKTTDNGKDVIMGIEHKEYPCFGVQFHPESIASVPYGKKIMKNFLKL